MSDASDVSHFTDAHPTPAASLDSGLIASLRGLDADGRRLFASRVLRMFAYGSLAVVLVLYLASLGLDAITIGAILTLTLVGDTIISLWLTTSADRIGRRRVLIAGSLLMVVAGVAFVATSWVPLLILAATVGVISPTGNEVGPFLAVEQAALSQATPDARRTSVFAWYNLAGYVATAVGALAAGLATQALLAAGFTDTDAYRAILIAYAALGLAMAAIFARVSPAIEASPATVTPDGIRLRLGLGRSRGIVTQAIGPVRPRCLRRRLRPAEPDGLLVPLAVRASSRRVLGAVFFGANLLAAVSSLSAARIAARIGLINTMVFTHLPSNVLLILVPLMPTLPARGGVSPAPLHAQPDGRADPPVVRDGGRRAGRAIRGGRA